MRSGASVMVRLKRAAWTTVAVVALVALLALESACAHKQAAPPPPLDCYPVQGADGLIDLTCIPGDAGTR